MVLALSHFTGIYAGGGPSVLFQFSFFSTAVSCQVGERERQKNIPKNSLR